jgi:hypothetical protein
MLAKNLKNGMNRWVEKCIKYFNSEAVRIRL